MKAMSDRVLFQLEKINKSLGDGFFLQDLNLELKAGEVHVVMGENGSGKSAVMQIISGIIQPDTGRLLLNGSMVHISSLSDAWSKSIVYIQQDANIFQNLSVAENIFYHQMPYQNRFFKVIDTNRLNRMCQSLIEDLKLPFSLFDPVQKMGMAQRQIMGFCKAYISGAQVVILDEPSTALTEHDRKILHTILQRMKLRGAGIFYISHKLDEIRGVGDRLTVLKKGRMVGTVDLKNTGDDEIIRMMSGVVLKNRYPRLKVKIGKEILRTRGLASGNILRGIDFSLHKGEILGVTGLAGSGRTFLANCLFGAAPLDRGTIWLNGKKVFIREPFDAIRHGMALVPEDRLEDSIMSCLDITSNASLSSLKRFSRFFTLNTTLLNQVVADYISKFNVDTEHYCRHMGEYSGGSQQKVVFARWIMNRSKVFILDEPTRCLDIPTRVDIYNSMNDLIQKGAGIIFISSDIEEILECVIELWFYLMVVLFVISLRQRLPKKKS